jgi:acylphosphatase
MKQVIMIARRFFVSGRVQGVGFRFFAIANAGELGITGWVKNLPDGRVEIHAEGESEPIKEFYKRLSRGPLSAVVVSVDVKKEAPTGSFRSFMVKY